MKRRSSEDAWQALNSVTDAAERFVNRSPRVKRLEAERQALLDVIRQAQLLLSVKRWPISSELNSPVPSLARGEKHRQGARQIRSK